MLKQLFKQTLTYGLSSILTRAIGFLLLPLHTHYIPTAEYGIVTDLYSILALVTVVLVYRMETAYFRYATDNKFKESAYTTGLNSLLVTTIGFATMVLLYSDPIINFLGYGNTLCGNLFLYYGVAIIIFDVGLELPFAKLRLQNKAQRFVFLKIIQVLFTVLMNVALIIILPKYSNQSVEGSCLVSYIFLANMLASGLVFVLMWREWLQVEWSFDRCLWRNMIYYSLPLTLAGLAGVANEVLDRQLLKYWLPFEKETNLQLLGIYGANYKLSVIITLFTQAFRYAAEPFFYRNAGHKMSLQINAQIAKYYVIFGLLGFLVVVFCLDLLPYIPIIGEEYLDGVNIVPVLLMANIFLGLYYNLSVWFKLTDRTYFGTLIMVLGVALMVLVNYYAIPRYYILGAAWATLITYVFITFLSYIMGRKYYPAPYQVGRVVLYFVGVWAVYYSVEYLLKPSMLELSGLIWLIRLLSFIGVLFLFWYIERKDLRKWLKYSDVSK